MYRILGIDQKQYGPVSADVVRQWIADRRANAQTLVQAEGGADWKPLSACPEFADALSAAASAGPAGRPPLGYAPSANAKTSGLAIASLVLGVLGFCGVTALAGIVLGIVAQMKISRSNGQLKGAGLAIAGICVSAFMLLFSIPVMAALLLPALAKAKARAQAINCVSNLKQLGLAMHLYANSNNDALPPASNWCDAVQSYAGSPKVFRCSADPAQARCAYGFNARLNGKQLSRVNPQAVLLFEMTGGWNASGGAAEMQTRHQRIYTVCLADGSARQVSEFQLLELRWEP